MKHKSNKYSYFVISFFLAYLVFIWFYSTKKEETLLKYTKVTTALITKIGSQKGRYVINYKFEINKRINSRSPHSWVNKNSKNQKLMDAIVGRQLPVVYDSTNIDNCFLLLFEDDYLKYNIQFPDSLNWLRKY